MWKLFRDGMVLIHLRGGILEKGIYFRGTGEQMPNFEGNEGTKTMLGDLEHNTTYFRSLGNRGTYQFI